MSTCGVYEAKTKLSKLLARVARGERITITRHGVPVAVLGPAPGPPRMSVAEAIEEIRRIRKGKRLGRLTIRQLIDEGRKH